MSSTKVEGLHATLSPGAKGRSVRSSNGNLWLGWGVYCGVPGTLAAFAIAGPLGLLVLAATITAIVIGSRVEKTRQVQDDIDRRAANRRDGP